MRLIAAILISSSLSILNPVQAFATSADSRQDVEAVLKLLTHLEVDNIGDDLFAMMAERTIPTMRSHHPNLPEAAYALLHEELAAAFRATSADLLTSNARLYLEYFTPDEVATLNAFYATSTGRKMLKVLPMLMQQSVYLGQEWVQKMDRDVRRNWTERLKQEGYLKE